MLRPALDELLVAEGWRLPDSAHLRLSSAVVSLRGLELAWSEERSPGAPQAQPPGMERTSQGYEPPVAALRRSVDEAPRGPRAGGRRAQAGRRLRARERRGRRRRRAAGLHRERGARAAGRDGVAAARRALRAARRSARRGAGADRVGRRHAHGRVGAGARGGPGRGGRDPAQAAGAARRRRHAAGTRDRARPDVDRGAGGAGGADDGDRRLRAAGRRPGTQAGGRGARPGRAAGDHLAARADLQRPGRRIPTARACSASAWR